MLAQIRRAVSPASWRRRKPAPLPIRPVPPLKSPATKLALDIDDAVTKLGKAVRAYATAPDEIPATIRADYAAGIALNALVDVLAAVHVRLDTDPNLLAVQCRDRVLYSLIVTYGLQSLLSSAAEIGELRDIPTRDAVLDRAEMLAQWVHDSAHLALLDHE